MRKEIITAIDRDGIEVRIHSLVFNIYKEKINLIDTIKGAVASYINSGYGFREYENNCYNFNWGDLLLIPNSFLRQFGIERESETESTEVDFNEQLFSANDLISSTGTVYSHPLHRHQTLSRQLNAKLL